MKRSALICSVLAPVLAPALLAPLTACAAAPGAAGGRLRVIASFYPMTWLAERVGGDRIAVSTLTKPGAEPHDLELSPRQVAEISDAALVVYVKGVQPAVDDAISQHARGRSLNAAALVRTLPATAEEAGEGRAGAAYDPHLWLDPARMAVVATALGERFAAADPANAAAYRGDAATAVTGLTALDGEFQRGLARCADTTIVTAHAAFGYLAGRYGLRQVGIAGIDPEAEPSPRRLAGLREEIRRTGATTVFTETLVSPKIAQTLAASAGVTTAVLDPIEGVRPGTSDDYPSIQRRNLATLRSALRCA